MSLFDEVSRFVKGADGTRALRTGKAGGRALQLVDLDGDVVAIVPIPNGQAGGGVTVLAAL